MSNYYLWATPHSEKIACQQGASIEEKSVVLYKLCNAEVLVSFNKINNLLRVSEIGIDFLNTENLGHNTP